MGNKKAFQLLEINIMSAQDLELVSKKMKTYATVCLNPSRRLTTVVDYDGRNNPTWNDKFVFRVDDEFLQRDTSAVQIDIYSVHWFRDSIVGTVRFLVGNLFPPCERGSRQNFGMRFVALQIRRPSGRPQGIMNIGVALLDSSMRSMPLYRQMSMSAVGFRDLMHEDHPLRHNSHSDDESSVAHHPVLRRMKSERSTLMSYDDNNNGSLLSIPPNPIKPSFVIEKESSILSISFEPPPMPPLMKTGIKKGKASSMVNGEELLRDDNKSKHRAKKGKASSVVSDTVITKDWLPKKSPPKLGLINYNENNDNSNSNEMVVPGAGRNNSILFGSEVGPSPSEVAAAVAAERRYPLEATEGSSMMDGWSEEGLRSKLERWRAELPPVYDFSSYAASSNTSSYHMRRRTDGGSAADGGFSCFGNIFGYECECVCGQPPASSNKNNKNNNNNYNNMYRSPSVGSYL